MPVVLLGERSAEGHTGNVGVDNVRAARGATEYLRSRGQQGTDRLRTVGYRQALATAGLPMALGALRALRESGVRVPGVMDLVGFDGIEPAGFGVPRLPSASPGKREIARTAVSLLLNRIDAADSGVPCRDVVIGQRIVVGERSGG